MIAGSILYLFAAGPRHGHRGRADPERHVHELMLLLAIPLFILAAEFMNTGSLTERLLEFCNAIVGRFRGGLAQVNVVQSIIFAGMSGSAIADAAGSGNLMQKMMTARRQYPPAFAAALTAVSSVIGPIIPPSIPMVLYALIADTSIGYLFLGGIVPGLSMASGQMLIVAGRAKRTQFPGRAAVPLREHARGSRCEAFPALMMPVVLLGGIYGGVDDADRGRRGRRRPMRLVISVVLYRSVSGGATSTARCCRARASTASIGMLIAGRAGVQLRRHRRGRAAHASALSSAGSTCRRSTFLLLVNPPPAGARLPARRHDHLCWSSCRCFMPTAQALGIDLVHFGVVAVVNIMIGLITPPYGLLLFIMANISKSPLRD